MSSGEIAAGTRAPVSSPAQGVLIGVAGRGVYFAAGYLASIVLARRLGPAAYGIYGVILSVLVWLEQVGKFTFAPAVAKLIPERGAETRTLERTASSLNLIFFTVVFALLWVAAPLLAGLFELGDQGTWWFRIAALDLPIFGWYAFNRGVLLGRREFFRAGVADALYSVMKFLGAVLILTFWVSVASALTVNILASAVAWLFLASRVSIALERPDAGEARSLVRLALPLGFYMVMLQTLGSLDLWLLKVLAPGTSDATIGLYVAARNVALVPSVIFMVVSDILLPSLSGALAARDTLLAHRYVQGGVRFLCLTLLPVCALFALGADQIMALLYSTTFQGGGPYLRIVIWYAAALPFVDLFASALNARGEPFLGGRALLVVMPGAIVVSALLIPSLGAAGAAAASAVIGAGAAIVLGALVYRRFGALLSRRTALKTAVALAVMAGVASQVELEGLALAAAYAGCLGIYSGMLVLLGEVTRNELASLLAFQPPKRGS